MPDFIKHLKQADNNFKLAAKLPPLPGADDWAVTILFYVAVHYLEAYFSIAGNHFQMHASRETAIRRDPKISRIFRDYREMYEYSRNARYECVDYDGQAIDTVKRRLVAIESTIRPLLK